MKKQAITEKQQLILDFLKEEVREKGYPPAIREICAATGLRSTATVHAHLESLESKGYIRRSPSKNRCIEILDAPSRPVYAEYVDVPIVGKVTAGAPVLASEDTEGYFPIPADVLGNYDAFMLRVRGDSMEGAGIFSGDLILVRRQQEANDGDIVVVLLEDSATVKRYYREENMVRLSSENSAYQDILTRRAVMIGRVIGLYRSLL